MISRDRLIELVAELLQEAADSDLASLGEEDAQWNLASEIVDGMLSEMQVEEGEETE